MSDVMAYPTLDPKTIVIDRATRQRQENMADIDDIKQSIANIGIINPIIVRTEDGTIKLVAGERRLTSALALGHATVPVRFFEDLSMEEAEVIELEENIKRKELAWRDQVRATGRIHALYKRRNASWKIEETANNLGMHHSYLRKILHVYEALDSGRIQKAESIDQAYNTLHRFSERKAESIVGDIIAKGATLFSNATSAAVNALGGGKKAATNTATTTVTENTTFTTVSAISVANESASAKEVVVTDLLETETYELKGLSSAETNAASDPIQCLDFIKWIKTYDGPKFTLIHCDFPYGNYRGGDSKGSLSALETEDFYDNNESIYWTLLDALTTDLDRIMSYSAHMLFWFNMNFYTETVSRLRKTGLMVHDHPIIWHKTGGPGGLGVVPGTAVTYPRRTYDTALLAVRGNRPLAKPGMNSYAAPTVGNKIHPSQKPEPMLRFFLSMLVDETTSVLDPTCGSAAALRAAEDLGAKHILGLELDENYAKTANTKTLQARILRQAGSLRAE